MALIEQIAQDWQAARLRARATRATGTHGVETMVEATLLGTLMGALTTAAKNCNPARPLTEAEVTSVVQKFLKAAEETAGLLANASGRDTEKAKYATECAVLRHYLPQPLSDAALQTIIREHQAQGESLKDIMSFLRTTYPGRYDGAKAAALARTTAE